jgi:RimJ/RimL family protein N-acetyltransferase
MPSSSPLPAELRTPRLLLRRQRPEHAPLIKEAVDASLEHLQASVAWAQTAPFPLAVLENRMAEAAASFDAGEEWTFTIFDPAGARVLGAAGLHPGDAALSALVGPDVAEAGYWLRTDATGHGYATEATAALVELAFANLGAGRVAICHDPRNTASAGVPRRLGFRSFGTISNERLPNRLAADGSVRRATRLWVLDAPSEGRGIARGGTAPSY